MIQVAAHIEYLGHEPGASKGIGLWIDLAQVGQGHCGGLPGRRRKGLPCEPMPLIQDVESPVTGSEHVDRHCLVNRCPAPGRREDCPAGCLGQSRGRVNRAAGKLQVGQRAESQVAAIGGIPAVGIPKSLVLWPIAARPVFRAPSPGIGQRTELHIDQIAGRPDGSPPGPMAPHAQYCRPEITA